MARNIHSACLAVCAFGVLASFAFAGTATATPITNLVISEIMYEPVGNDNTRQWIEIFNGTGTAVDLSTYEIQWGRQGLASSVSLSGIVAANSTFVIGGPTSDANNGFPVYDQVFDFVPNLGDGSHAWQEDGVALVETSSGTVMHIVVYGGNGFFSVYTDEQGNTAPIVDDSALTPGQSLVYTGAGGWVVQSSPTPGVVDPGVPTIVPDPSTGMLLGIGLAGLSLMGSRRTSERRLAA